MIKCAYCGQEFEKIHKNQKYCSEKCRKEARREKRRIYNSRYFYKNRNRIYATTIGTRTIGAKPNKDPNKEEEIVKKEIKRIGLKQE